MAPPSRHKLCPDPFAHYDLPGHDFDCDPHSSYSHHAITLSSFSFVLCSLSLPLGFPPPSHALPFLFEFSILQMASLVPIDTMELSIPTTPLIVLPHFMSWCSSPPPFLWGRLPLQFPICFLLLPPRRAFWLLLQVALPLLHMWLPSSSLTTH